MGQSASGISTSRSTTNANATNNLPPLLFHTVHGENIRISRDGTVARRVESFCKGIAFSARPVKLNEKVHIKFVEISNNWSGVIRFGFTYNDPATLRHGLPKYACPDLTNKPGYWAKALPERFCSQGTLLFYYATPTGDVHFGVNGEEKGVFFGGVETRGPLWVLIDVYGNSTAIEFGDARHQLNNARRPGSCDADEIERIVYPMQQVQIQEEVALPVLRYQPAHLSFNPMLLHRTRGRNVRFGSSRNNAYRTDTEFCQGYVFTARPLTIGERVVVQVLATEPMYQGCLGLGLTSCDPATLTASDLPDDSNFLLDRPEYWVLSRDFARNLNKGDEISFSVAPSGQVEIRRNGADAPMVVIHVDHSLRLWAFFDIYGATQRVRVVSCAPPASPSGAPASPATDSTNSLNSASEMRRSALALQGARVCCTPADVQVQAGSHGGTVLSVLLPASAAFLRQGAHIAPQAAHFGGAMVAPVPVVPANGTMISNCSSTYVEPISDTSSYSTPLGWMEQNGATLGAGTECTICYENPIDAVLYMCGHMCMCYECALQQWRGKGGGHCPLCRAVIRDVIRTYKS